MRYPRAARLVRILIVLVAAAIVVHDLSGATSISTSRVYDPSYRAFAFARLLLVAIAALIALGRTTTRRDALLFGGLLGLALEVFWEFVPFGPFFWPAAIGAPLAVGFGVAQLLRYAAGAHANPTVRRTATVLALVTGAGVAACGIAAVVLGFGSWNGQMLDDATFRAVGWWLDRARWTFMLAAVASMEMVALASLRASPDRSRALLVAFGFAPLALATGLHALSEIVHGDVPLIRDVDALGYVLTATILTYGALTRRLIDVEYAVIASFTGIVLLAAAALGAFLAEHLGVPLIEGLVERTPALQPLGEPVRAYTGLAGGFGAFLLIGRFHEKLDEFVRSLLFKRRDERVRELLEFARERLWELDPRDLPDALAHAVAEGAGTRSVGVYAKHGAVFRSLAHVGDAPATIAETDARIPSARAPRYAPGGGLSVPMPVAGALCGFVLCGPRDATASYARDEMSALALVGREAGNALAAFKPEPASPSPRKRRPKRARRRT